MCGRFALTAMPEELREVFGVMEAEDFPPRYNIAPTQPILIVRARQNLPPGSNRPMRELMLARWGLIPGWAKDPSKLPLLFNARSETAHEKAAFRAAMRHRRILVPASGFYEWRRSDKGRSGARPFWIRPRQGGIVAFAGLLETYLGADGSEIDTAAVLTTRANATLAPIHDRMPVVIAPDAFSRWLDCKDSEPRDVADLLGPADDDFFERVPVSQAVNKVANDNPDLQARCDDDEAAAEPSPPGEQLSLL
ncbi:SOS response-associated peptidase [Pararhizobium haloflavum]|uniref:SOS response-associated peptidase n=1 Tax=Pararhizobium haloflavum TaxID=2037914 RepID=UPI000C18744E|nr:SOS response-associated peptidase [Pararhizobium haloflavum]